MLTVAVVSDELPGFEDVEAGQGSCLSLISCHQELLVGRAGSRRQC